MAKSLQIEPPEGPLTGEIRPPSDRTITQLALIASSLAVGSAQIRNALENPETVATRRILAHLGVSFSTDDEGWLVVSRQGERLKAPEVELDCGQSLQTLRLMSAVLSGHAFSSELSCDRDYTAILAPQINRLKEMGARIEQATRDGRFITRIRGNPLRPVTCQLQSGESELKSAMLLASLFAVGECRFDQTGACYDHTERMMRTMGVVIRRLDTSLILKGEQRIYPRWLKIPGDVTAAAPFIAAAVLKPGSDLVIKETGTNPGRTGFLKCLARAKARITREKSWQYGAEPIARIRVAHSSELAPVNAPPNLAPSMLNELPLLALVASQVDGTSHIKGVSLLAKEAPGRPELAAQVLRKFGVDIEFDGSGYTVRGSTPLEGAEVQCAGDQHVALLAATAALIAKGNSTIHGIEPATDLYPGLLADLTGTGNPK